MLVFVTGGSASGKSEYAEQRCLELSAAQTGEMAENAGFREKQAGEMAENAGSREKQAGEMPENAGFRQKQNRVSPSPAQRIYLATMMSQGEGSRERILRHRRLREGKGFQTVECPMQIGSAPVSSGSTVLLECLSNLLANEMFCQPEKPAEAMPDEGVPKRSSKDGNKPESGKNETLAEGDFFRYGNQTAERILREVFALREKAEHLIVVSNQIFSEGLTYDPMTEAYRRALGWLNAQLVQASDEAWEVVCGIPLQMKPGRSSAGFRVK